MTGWGGAGRSGTGRDARNGKERAGRDGPGRDAYVRFASSVKTACFASSAKISFFFEMPFLFCVRFASSAKGRGGTGRGRGFGLFLQLKTSSGGRGSYLHRPFWVCFFYFQGPWVCFFYFHCPVRVPWASGTIPDGRTDGSAPPLVSLWLCLICVGACVCVWRCVCVCP